MTDLHRQWAIFRDAPLCVFVQNLSILERDDDAYLDVLSRGWDVEQEPVRVSD
jgi:hypothetical protein